MTDEKVRKRLIAVLTVFTVVCMALGVAGFLRGDPDPGTARFYLRNDGGAVLFEHARHGRNAGNCVTCHHELAAEVMACTECHDDEDYTPDMADHDELLEYHERACDNCHEIAPDDEATSCRECHDDDLSGVYHKSCSACHLATAPERFADEAGAPLCRECHLR